MQYLFGSYSTRPPHLNVYSGSLKAVCKDKNDI